MEWMEKNCLSHLPQSQVIDDFTDEFRTFGPSLSSGDPSFTDQVFSVTNEESFSAHSSDSGNYSPTTSSNHFELENSTQWWQCNQGSVIVNDDITTTMYPSYEQPEDAANYLPPFEVFDPQINHHQDAALNFIPNSISPNQPIYDQKTSPYCESISNEKSPASMLFLIKQSPAISQPIQRVIFPNSIQTHVIDPIQPKSVNPTPVKMLPKSIIQTKRKLEENEFLKKREERKMRNREAAQLSRQRKKEENDKIKAELKQLYKRCELLEDENRQLRRKIQQLEREGHKSDPPKEASSNGSRPKVTVRLAGLCMLMFFSWMVLPDFNFNENKQTRFLLENKGSEIIKTKLGKSHGRSLGSISGMGNFNGNMNLTRPTNLNATDGFGNITSSCGNLNNRIYNETLNIKLNEDLLTWVSRHEKMELLQLHRGKLPPLMRKTNDDKPIPPLPKLRINSSEFEADNSAEFKDAQQMSKEKYKKRRIRETRKEQQQNNGSMARPARPDHLRRVLSLVNRKKNIDDDNAQSGQQQKLRLDVQQMAKFVNGIKGREEQESGNTLYVIPLNDYFLLSPTLDGNYTAKVLPRLSIILPALSPPLDNSTASFNQYSMIRIECEVTGTNLFNLPGTLVDLLSK